MLRSCNKSVVFSHFPSYFNCLWSVITALILNHLSPHRSNPWEKPSWKILLMSLNFQSKIQLLTHIGRQLFFLLLFFCSSTSVLNAQRIKYCRLKKQLTFVAEEVKLHAQQPHSFTEGVRGRAFLLRAELQDLQGRQNPACTTELTVSHHVDMIIFVCFMPSPKTWSLPAAGRWRGTPLFVAGTISAYEACWHQAPQTGDSSTPDAGAARRGSAEERVKRWRWQAEQRTDRPQRNNRWGAKGEKR